MGCQPEPAGGQVHRLCAQVGNIGGFQHCRMIRAFHAMNVSAVPFPFQKIRGTSCLGLLTSDRSPFMLSFPDPMKTSQAGYPIRCVLAALTAAVILSISIPHESKFLQELENAGHALLFGVVAIVMLKDRKAGRGAYFRTFFAATLLGVGTELMQSFEGRDAEVLDVVRDALGAAAFLGFTWTLRHGERAPRRFLIRMAALGIIVVVFWQPISTGAAFVQRWHSFPMIADFHSQLQARFCSTGNARLEICPAPWEATEYAAKVTFEPAHYSGFSISGPWPDWSTLREFDFTVYSGLPDPVSLNLRIHDAHHNNQYRDRFNKELEINPGLNFVKIPLTLVEKSPSGRRMDLARIRGIGLFVVKPANPFDLFLSDFKLH